MVNIKDKILESALKQFLMYGKSGAKTKAIADDAGVNKALIHYYYSSKEQLFICCVKDILERMQSTFHTVDVRTVEDYPKYLGAVIDSYTAFILKHDKQLMFLLWEYFNDKKLIVIIKEIMGSAHLDDFINKTNRAIEDGIIRSMDPLNLYLNLVSLILSSNLLLPITRSFLEQDSNEEIVEQRKEEIIRLLWRDIKGE
ncbi:TetR/AcrR family transcriptional regulator [Thiospirochaeta perfilievii]|uniref:TetR/AcrR family transcriptional regulator n=1 Tax=Thiospirochaeta perfilievii TaxID=252967 RepID=A0A5C1QFX3_9SPIO|nr:TetR/AcrR family transcriptional regulator [Thiospirochaeta perfilievii]QEN05494.1 TetR/AcrR family transcriptional regulator [Thiospirochaeta perfilievii]